MEDMKAKDIMATVVASVGPDTEVSEIARTLISRRISAVPVIDSSGKMLGMVSEGDLMRREESDTERRPSWWLRLLADTEGLASDYVKSHGTKAKEVMTRDVTSVAAETSVSEIAEILEEKHIKRVPVISDGKVVGIVSRADILRTLASTRSDQLLPSEAGDETIRGTINCILEEQPWYSDANLNVIVTDGVVHLWGTISGAAERDAIQVAIRDVPGVKDIHDHLGIIPPRIWA
jgi:CBS domain-containing protein